MINFKLKKLLYVRNKKGKHIIELTKKDETEISMNKIVLSSLKYR